MRLGTFCKSNPQSVDLSLIIFRCAFSLTNLSYNKFCAVWNRAVGIYDQSGYGSPGSFLEECDADPTQNNIQNNYPFWQIDPPSPVTYWNSLDDFAKGLDTVQMEDCVTNGVPDSPCGGICGHWDEAMFPDQDALDNAGASEFIQTQDIMNWRVREDWAAVISGLSLGTLKDVGYDGIVQDTSDPSVTCPTYEVRTADLSTLNYPVLKPADAGNRGDTKVMILKKDLDFEGIIDLPLTYEVEH